MMTSRGPVRLTLTGDMPGDVHLTGRSVAVVEVPAEAAQGRTRTLPGAGDGKRGLHVVRRYTKAGVHPYDEVPWEKRDATITNEKGEVIFEQKGVEFPTTWSVMAGQIVASKYFRGHLGTADRETSLRQLIDRVVKTITGFGRGGNYFATEEDAQVFEAELTHIMLHQMASFNSPVWFNVGVEPKPQGSACFINSVEDTMGSILELAKTEGMLFKYGSGTGTNLSTIRSSRELLRGGGTASGPVSFMKGFDSFAGVIKSGGKTRRAAKMVILNADHPDVLDFIRSKAVEEKKAHALIEAGFNSGFNVVGGAYDSVQFQNANHSVRVTDEFMRAVLEDREWHTRAVTDGRIIGTYRARDMMREMADSAWICGDPGMQFDTTVNDWNPCASSARINASNPCSEYMFLDDTACNLASLNLMRFRTPEGEFDVPSFCHAVELVFSAQEFIIDNASYPTKSIERNSFDFRPLGLGYANLGALLMDRGLPYDSEAGRAYAAAITSLMTGWAYRTSALIAAVTGPFKYFDKNRNAFLRVLEKHRAAAYRINADLIPAELLAAARVCWDDAYDLGAIHGIKNAQATVLAPTGTIGLMMDCDTTGVEPDLALVKYKKLVGGGMIKIVNQTVPEALTRLGYSPQQVDDIKKYIDGHDTIEGAPHIKDEHLPVFDCSLTARGGRRSIHYMGHVRMMAATQPFLSGAISKTVNMPSESTTKDVETAYVESWKLGLKAIAIYRDGCKRSQPLSAKTDAATAAAGGAKQGQPVRRRLPEERRAMTHKFSIDGNEGYITVGMFEDGSPGEIFIVMAKEGSVVSGLMDSFATSVSLALQYGVPLEVLINKFSHTRFEPSGYTKNQRIKYAKSLTDYIFRWLAMKFLPAEEHAKLGILPEAPGSDPAATPAAQAALAAKPVPLGPLAATGPALTPKLQETLDAFSGRSTSDAPPCHACGMIMTRSGSCYKCSNCGETSGCS